MKKQDKKASVLLYIEWAGPLRCLPLDDVGRLFLAMMDYTATGENPVFDSPGAAMAWEFIRMRLDENQEKWENICQHRQTAGRRGAEATNSKERQKAANPANAAFAERPAAKPADNENENVNGNENVNENENVNVAAKAALQASPDGEPPLPPPECEQEQEKAHTPEAQWVALGLGKTLGPIVRQTIQTYREAGLEDGLMVEAMREAAAHQVKAPAAYLDSILGRCRAEGILTLSAWQARKRPAGAGLSKRVDRPTPSGNDFLADAVTRPRRHKRKNPA